MKGQLRVALDYLLKVRNLEEEPVYANMNACAVLSELGRHEEAKEAGMEAIVLLQEGLLEWMLPKMGRKRQKREGEVEGVEKEFKERVANLALCYG
jgi:hypothetical protein